MLLLRRTAAILAAILAGLGICWSQGRLAVQQDAAASTLIAQACLPCQPGCFDPTDGCHPGTTNGSCGANGATCQGCQSNQTCLNQACCTKRTCASAGAACGTLSDGCGGSLSCGICANGGSCVSNQCAAFDCSTCNCGCNSTATACFKRKCGPNQVWDADVCACTE